MFNKQNYLEYWVDINILQNIFVPSNVIKHGLVMLAAPLHN